MKDFITSVDVRKPLAIIWTIVAAYILIYSVMEYGSDKATLNLIIGTVGGSVIGGIFGYYFSDSAKKPEPTPTAPVAPQNDTQQPQ